MMRSKSVLTVLISFAVVVGAYEVVLYFFQRDSGEHFKMLWILTFCVLLTWWVEEDSHGRKNIYRPFEFSYLAFIWILPYAPYYLVRTRGAVGAAWAAGLYALLLLGPLLKLLIKAVS